jgi:hypothetical protein
MALFALSNGTTAACAPDVEYNVGSKRILTAPGPSQRVTIASPSVVV